MINHLYHKQKINIKNTIFYFDYEENSIQFYKNEFDELLMIYTNNSEYRIYDKDRKIKYIIDYSNSKTFSEKNYYNDELTYENIYYKESKKLKYLNKYNSFGNICTTYKYRDKLKEIIKYKDCKIFELYNRNNKFIEYKLKNIELLNEGYVYILSNNLFNGFKIGMTKNKPEKRIKNLNTSVPVDYELEYYMYFNDRKKAEREIQSKLDNIKREFYSNNLEEIKKVFAQVKWEFESKFYADI
ncbi:hypothetical protein AACT_1766 [Arcobacter acticola]|uniref:Bacteriophage T5 Orf172 DNA-binding domain-containing protein n=1 Tax=Arcobacter acticola TaxID=1849015 RepID=A0A6M8EWM0_9BACT|nr:GIY-YIG nuclease family protein [Arcobacter acticola]QKE28917.1 hypothetical protein AACT_1766 [Arcobacter acticola]